MLSKHKKASRGQGSNTEVLKGYKLYQIRTHISIRLQENYKGPCHDFTSRQQSVIISSNTHCQHGLSAAMLSRQGIDMTAWHRILRMSFTKYISLEICNWTTPLCFWEVGYTDCYLLSVNDPLQCAICALETPRSVSISRGLIFSPLLRTCDFKMPRWVVPCSDFSNQTKDMASATEQMACAIRIQKTISNCWTVP